MNDYWRQHPQQAYKTVALIEQIILIPLVILLFYLPLKGEIDSEFYLFVVAFYALIGLSLTLPGMERILWRKNFEEMVQLRKQHFSFSAGIVVSSLCWAITIAFSYELTWTVWLVALSLFSTVLTFTHFLKLKAIKMFRMDRLRVI